MQVGSAFAINRQNFWDLGSYDDGLKVWQGEQLELSLKAHLCGIGMVEVPCSRVAHSYRNKNFYKRFGDDGQDYMIRNYKRIAEVWLDNYKEIVYERSKAKYAEADVGDMLRAKAIKRGLNCKPFSYFLEFVAPEMLERYPLEDPGCFAQGTIQSKAVASLCIEVPKSRKTKLLELKVCEKNLIQPSPQQFFKLAWHRNIQHHIYDFCIRDSLTMAECHFAGGNQFWKYDLVKQSFKHDSEVIYKTIFLQETSQISNPRVNSSRCLTLMSESYSLTMKPCDPQDINQKWNWGEKNITALQSWESFGVDLGQLKLLQD